MTTKAAGKHAAQQQHVLVRCRTPSAPEERRGERPREREAVRLEACSLLTAALVSLAEVDQPLPPGEAERPRFGSVFGRDDVLSAAKVPVGRWWSW